MDFPRFELLVSVSSVEVVNTMSMFVILYLHANFPCFLEGSQNASLYGFSCSMCHLFRSFFLMENDARFQIQVRRTDVLSAWSGIRPLAIDPKAKSTESISRDHVVAEEHPGLVTITGGKWTTYRR